MIEKYGVAIHLHDFGQKTFEKYQMAVIRASKEAFVQFSQTTNDGVTATAFVRGETVREALKAGIISGIEPKDIDEMKPYVVSWIADEIQNHVKLITTAPTDPN